MYQLEDCWSHKDASINSLFGRIASLRGARNPHVPERTFRLLRAARLALHPEKRIYRSAQSQRSRVRLALPQPLYLLRSSSGEDTGLSTQVRGFDSRTKHHYFRGLVQLEEHRTLTANVAGSIPASSANFFGALTHWLSTCLSSRMKSVRFRYASPTVACAPLVQSVHTLDHTKDVLRGEFASSTNHYPSSPIGRGDGLRSRAVGVRISGWVPIFLTRP
jgi:hypothetical protein